MTPNHLDSLPEVVALAVQLPSYMAVAQLTMYTYDWLLSVSEEYEIVSKAGLSRSNMLYFLARIVEFGHQLIVALLLFVPMRIESCKVVIGIFGTCAVVSVALTSFLFLLRIRAVYLKSRFIIIFFGALWLFMMMICILQSASLRGDIIPGTEMCTYSESKDSIMPAITSFVVLFVNDTLVFLAISFRLSANAVTDESWRSRFLSIVKGKGLYRLSRSLLISGQIYYLAIIIFFFTNLAMIVSPSIPTTDKFVIVQMFSGLTTMVACRVFRGVALDMMEDHPVTGLSSTRIAAAMQLDTFPSAPRSKSDVVKY